MVLVSAGYGYDGSLDIIRAKYKNMPRAYLDNAGAPLVISTIPYRAADALASTTLVNPHSQGHLGSQTSKLVDQTRNQVLKLLNADPAKFEVVFCANATAAAKLVGEAIYESKYAYCQDSHTSLVGLRELAVSFDTFSDLETLKDLCIDKNSLVSWPLQSNFDGRRYPGKEWVRYLRDCGALSLLDLASYASSEMPDLNEIAPDFAVISFYKVFGYPDMGALIVRKSEATLEFLSRKRYFGGGTVASLAPSKPWVVRSSDKLSDWLEDGTLPFHTVLTLNIAIDEFKCVYGENFSYSIAQHTKAVAAYCRQRLTDIQGCIVYNADGNAPIVTFRLLNIGHHELAVAASMADIHLRGGTLCNTGAFVQNSTLTDTKIMENYLSLGKKCNDEISFIEGEATGVLRASFGPYSSLEDVDALLDLLKTLNSGKSVHKKETEQEPTVLIEQICVYPIKSCAPLILSESELTHTGLKHDRLLCVVALTTKKVLTLKLHRPMAFLKPTISYDSLVVLNEPPEGQSAKLRLPLSPKNWSKKEISDNLVLNMESGVIEFFSNAIGVPCTIAKHVENDPDPTTTTSDLQGSVSQEHQITSSFAQVSPLLVVNTASAKALELTDIMVFRPNIVINSKQPWAEDEWTRLIFESDNSSAITLQGRCRRCNMICVTSEGTSNSFPYMQLCQHRKINGKIYFGQHAKLESSGKNLIIKKGDKLRVG